MRSLAQLREAVERFKKEIGFRLREEHYIVADTRVSWVSLYDHLALTAGFAVAMVTELMLRGKTPKEICGKEENLREEDLRALACLGGLLHDIGKSKEGATEYRRHVERGVEFTEAMLRSWSLDECSSRILLGIVARHHLRDLKSQSSLLEKVVCLADSYASAGDRPGLSKGETREELERITKNIKELEKELFEDNLPLVFLMADVDSVKSYVYETRSLPEIRGGSEILQELEEEIVRMFREKLAEECLLYCGGGGLLAVLPASEAPQWASEIERLYPERTKVATVTVVTSPPVGYQEIARGLFPQDTESIKSLTGKGVASDLLFSHFEALVKKREDRKNFGELVAYLAGKLQQKKREKRIAPFFATLPFQARCTSCGKRAGEKEDLDELLCGVCYTKREKGREQKRAFVESFTLFLKKKDIPLAPEGLKYPKDLDALAGGKGYIALLYADGNNMGDILQRATSPAFFRHFSETMKKITHEALFEAFVKTFGSKTFQEAEEPLPFEIVALGGDDVVAIVPGSAGWALAVHFLEAFEKHEDCHRLQQEMQNINITTPLSMSAGLAIADLKYPVSFLLSITEGLLKRAKHLAREKQQSTLCHFWLKAPVFVEGGEKLLAALYERPKDITLTARPYTLEDAKKLNVVALHLLKAGIAATRLRSFAEALESGVHTSLNFIFYQIARMKKDKKEKALKALKGLETLVGDSKLLFFWAKRGDRWVTPLLDVLELMELGAFENLQEGEYARNASR
ncbi:MAG: HD domain-containing protein [Candidatus Caldatribacterium sp.]|nr:HD domain-containing protein [Candidatus Caldatribacterium sp.]